MKYFNIIILFIAACVLISCSKEESLTPSGDLGFQERFSPADTEPQGVKDIFNKFGLWLRMDFEDDKEVTNAILVQDVNNRYGATQIDEEMKPSAIMFVDTLLNNVSVEFVQEVFPREFFFVKTYNGSFWQADIETLGRSRLIVCWPNERTGVQPIEVPETHYYQDSVLTRMVWASLTGLLAQRMEKEIPGFEAAGSSYDNGQALDELTSSLASQDLSDEEYGQIMDEFAAERGVILPAGTRGYTQDLSQWLRTIVTESYENIYNEFLQNSPNRLEKYNVLCSYLLEEYNWDIQAAGNKYRELLDALN